MRITLDNDSIKSLEIDITDSYLPTCHVCGNPMNEITVMEDCLYSERKKITHINAQSVHFHFHHKHRNAIFQPKQTFYCPLTNNSW